MGAPMHTNLTTGNAHTDAALFRVNREQFDYPVVARFHVDGEPVSKARARFTKRGSKTFAYTPDNVKAAEERIGWAFRAAAPSGYQPLEGVQFGVVALFFNGTRQRRDVDNMVKLVLDGLNGVAWKDDSQVSEISARKMYFLSEPHPRTEVLIYTLGDAHTTNATCENCGKAYNTFPSLKSRYCSTTCAYDHRATVRVRTCENCGEEFKTDRAPSKSPRFCSADCRAAKGRVTIPCKICATPFRQFKSWAETRPYCSQGCVAENARIRARERRSKSFPGECLVCGAGTTRKEYKRCNPCKLAGKKAPK